MTPEPCSQHVAQGGPGAAEGAVEGDVEHAVHCSSVMSTRSAVPPRPALLIITSTPPSASTAAGEQRLHLGLVGDVADGGRRSAPARRPSGRRPPEAALVDVGDHHRGALLEHALGRGEADAGAGGGGDDAPSLPASRSWPGGVVGGAALGLAWGVCGLAGQAEHPLADDVALDLVGAAVDRVGAGEEEQPLRSGQLVGEAVGDRGVPARARPWPARRGRGARWPRTAW